MLQPSLRGSCQSTSSSCRMLSTSFAMTLLSCNRRALDRVTKQKHRPNGQKLSQKCPKIVFSVPPDNFWTFFGHLFDSFRTFFRHSLFLGCPTICPLQLYVSLVCYDTLVARIARNQDKGVLATGVSAASSVMRKTTKTTQGYWSQKYIWHSGHHSQERCTHLQNPPSRNPLFVVPEKPFFFFASSVSSSQPVICVPKRTHRGFGRTHRVCPKTQ